MFKIYDGRDCFYQWDVDRKLIVDDTTIDEVHFCNGTDDCSLICEVYTEGNLRLVDVPNILLQNSLPIRVYGYDENYTEQCKYFNVRRRTKPADYIYTETELKDYDELAARVDEIEKNGISEESINTAVKKYLDENPIEITGYATEAFVQEQIEEIELTPGPAGPQGKPGKDGYTPVKGIDYFDGAPGANGKNGHTPIKGTDYWTTIDKAEMVSDVLAALPIYNGEVSAE